jgi:hypothetical protein
MESRICSYRAGQPWVKPGHPRGTGHDNGATDRGYGSCGDGRVKSPAMTG